MDNNKPQTAVAATTTTSESKWKARKWS